MRDVPDIAPEIHALLEEIVADPRSAIRFAPRRALRSWFDSGEVAHAGDVAETSAGKHLIAAYREELAELLLTASEIAYSRAAVFFHRPLGASGQPVDPSESEPAWRTRAERTLATSPRSEDVTLLKTCLEGIPGDLALSLAQASLALVPSDRARIFMATCVPWSQPRYSLLLLDRLLEHVADRWKPTLFRHRAARLCELGLLGEARDTYRRSSTLAPESPIERFYSFNLSCFVDDPGTARLEAQELAKLVSSSDVRIDQAKDILRIWIRSQSAAQREAAKRVVLRISASLPSVVHPLCEAVQS